MKYSRYLYLLIMVFLISCSKETIVENPTENFGSILIDSNPQGAKIFLLGTNTNKLTPDSILNLESGDYEITLKRVPYEDTTLVANVKSGLRTTIFVDFDSTTGVLIVKSIPDGANIFIDDSLTNKTTPDTIYSIKAGNHAIKVQKEGYVESENNINVIKGMTTTVEFTLQELFSY